MRPDTILAAGQEAEPVAEAMPAPQGELLTEPRRQPLCEGPIVTLLQFVRTSLAIPARLMGRFMGRSMARSKARSMARLVAGLIGRVAGGYAGARASSSVSNVKAMAALSLISRISLGGAKALLVIECKTGGGRGSEAAAQAAGQRFLVAVNADAVTSIRSIDSRRPHLFEEPYRRRLLPVRRLSGATGSARASGRPRRSRSEH